MSDTPLGVSGSYPTLYPCVYISGAYLGTTIGKKSIVSVQPRCLLMGLPEKSKVGISAARMEY